MTDKEVTLLHTPLLEPSKQIRMKFKEDELADCLKVTKGKLPALLDTKHVNALLPSNCIPCQMEVERAQVFMALTKAYNEWDLDTSNTLVQNVPTHAVYAAHDMKKGYLVPYPEKLCNIVMKEPSNKHGQVKYMGKTFYIIAPKMIDDDGVHRDGMWSPFWPCLKEGEEGQLEYKWQQYHLEDTTRQIQILTNSNAVLKHGQLLLKGNTEPHKKRRTN